ncbi:hypothetical protein GUJ93_ZPchr0012g20606 [Zizania palustris]|uniref:Uncharacterized protein n=1 Tax=Zizania palustris TaxID=103762 RepID=A0A8J6BXX6_ZIZPA|nr:hypothetical protein GUJ93_ZPchr0012g20606 [Zizania palustris]
MLVALPATRHRASAVRIFPPGCGRHHRAAHSLEQELQPRPSTADLLRPPKPSARTATRAPSHARQTVLTAAEGTDRVEGNGSTAGIEVPAAAGLLARLVSAVRTYPPGCGRGAAVSNSGTLVGGGDAEPNKPHAAVVCNGEANTTAGDQKVVVCEGTLDRGDSDSDDGLNCGGDVGGPLEEGGGRPWNLTGLMLAPFLPWAQHGRRRRRSQRRKLL